MQDRNDIPEQSKSKWHQRINPTENNDLATERGVITELIWNVDILKRISKDVGTVGIAMLGTFAEDKLAQITVHTTALAEDEAVRGSYTFYVKESVVKEAGIVKGCFVIANLRGIVLSKKHPIWVCEQLTDLYDIL